MAEARRICVDGVDVEMLRDQKNALTDFLGRLNHELAIEAGACHAKVSRIQAEAMTGIQNLLENMLDVADGVTLKLTKDGGPSTREAYLLGLEARAYNQDPQWVQDHRLFTIRHNPYKVLGPAQLAWLRGLSGFSPSDSDKLP